MSLLKSNTGLSLIEFIVSIALGAIIITILSRLLVMVYHEQQQQHILNTLSNDAYSAMQTLKNDANKIHNFHCLNAHTIDEDPQQLAMTQNGIRIYSASNPTLKTLLPPNVIKKLAVNSNIIIFEAPSSADIAINFINPNQAISNENIPISNSSEILIHNCQRSWLMKIADLNKFNHQLKITLPIKITNLNNPFSLSSWQHIFWFIMKNSQGEYGLYRLQKPDEKAPVEIINHATQLTAQLLLQQNIATEAWQSTINDSEWHSVRAIRLQLTLQQNNLKFIWPTTIILPQ